MSDHVCPRCCREFSGEQEARFREDQTRQKRLSELKQRFNKESGWESRRTKAEILLTFLFFVPVILYMIFGGLLLILGSVVFDRYLSPLLVVTILITIITSIFWAVGFTRLDKKEKVEFEKWRLEHGI
ncbi:MAG: hypothetical protein A3B86_01525 [Candidatus Yanofskybacteria bacterium RIFCSPHIGHO2_02_FULL_38_22b]|uniref:Uncharacterized protein n=1 Tax=Candidatus Yanofskybacteria bacterium RIFCSPHIGHO2_02_FULL_38_22b TaxID=1802673 RepID=A0A1F8F481_9BACT|nr:MAG: hypothetical protein A3B86_01525 [Candidatus Yanofskybacteria bacterium RIFCSPHIGHO2_02_FULL_38_22b]OGN19830.1 MAG: hypothetical protein A2910_02105 [Candidatus Yanofskybacteria bacterium RIFCSPLOWO2_01_FULL_39_28]